MQKLTRKAYSDLYGITVGDSVRLGDTNLWVKVEKDLSMYGEEAVFGGGKTLRDGMGQNPIETRENPKVMDLVITNCLIVDHRSIYKADIGVKDGKIAAIGHAGNPLLTDNVDMIVGVGTEAFAGEGKIFTAGGIDTHVHALEPNIVDIAMDNGLTTIICGGTGLNDGTKSATATPGPWFMKRMMQACENMPMNIGFLGKGHGAAMGPLEEQIAAGACGLKIHEDWGATHSSIDWSLRAADKFDVQVAIHTDTLNENGFVEDTMKCINGRVIHTYHSEGAGGGHAPDIMVVTKYSNILPSSTSPTIPYTVNTLAEHLDMLMVCHHLNPKVPEDVAFADSRIRKQTIMAEDILHDMGAISATSSDTLAMGRIGEVVARTWQMADKMKNNFGFLKGDSQYNDNNRVKRYIAKYTINPAIIHGVSDYIGSIDIGKIADIVCWEPKFFGIKPYCVFKAGMISRAVCGDENASIPTCEPMVMRPAYGSEGSAVQATAVYFTSQLAMERNIKAEYGLRKTLLPVRNCRNLSKKDLVNNTTLPDIEIDPQTFNVSVSEADLQNWVADASSYAAFPKADNGKRLILQADPLEEAPLAQRYFLY